MAAEKAPSIADNEGSNSRIARAGIGVAAGDAAVETTENQPPVAQQLLAERRTVHAQIVVFDHPGRQAR